jgi:hypothetical protein
MSDTKITKENLARMSREDLAALALNLSSIVQKKDEEIANLRELYKLRTAERYLPSSEQVGWLFQELEILDAVLSEIPGKEEATEVAAHSRYYRYQEELSHFPQKVAF